MDEREALIQTILDNPTDDAARLVYADWQQEHGNEAHAELIRAQLAGTPEGNARAAELLARPEFAALTEFNTFERGFVTGAKGFGGFDGFGALEGFTAAEGYDVRTLDEVPLDRVLFVDCCDYGDSCWPNPESAARVAAHPVARRVRRMSFFECSLDAGVLRAFANSPHLLNLRDVFFNDCGTAPAAIAELLLAPGVRVERLRICGENNYWYELAEPLARVLADPRAARLRVLNVSADFTAPSLADALLAAPDLPNLRVQLRASADWLTPAVRAALVSRYGARIAFEDWNEVFSL